MFIPRDDIGRPINSADELVEAFHNWGKPRERWLIGAEYEMLGVCLDDPDRPRWPGYDGHCGIGSIYRELAELGWSPIREGEDIIALTKDGAQVTTEPAGQFEHAMRPVKTALEMERDARAFLRELAGPSRARDLAWLGVGFRPFGRLDDVRWMPKERYLMMRTYLPTKGELANEMMGRTATVQVNLDYSDADDAKAKLRCLMSVTSLLTAIYANSSIVDEAISDFQSYRSFIWTDTDPDRCGLLRCAFEDGDVFRRYVEWALDVPMAFLYRDGAHIPAEETTFRQFLHQGFKGFYATLDDWELHLSLLYPEARMKRIIEVRGCDGGSFEMNMSLAPLCRGLLYDETACREATKLTGGLEFEERFELLRAVARRGLRAEVPRKGHRVLDLARELVRIAEDGLRRSAPEELGYLEPVRRVVDTGRTQADELADLWARTGGRPGPIVEALAHPGVGGA